LFIISKKEIPKLTYNEQKELDTIEDHITELEYQMKDIDELIQASGNDYSKTKELYIQRELVEKTLNDKLERWAYLTDIKEKSKRKS
jgi:ATP-binding cassette subfamily F protein uup